MTTDKQINSSGSRLSGAAMMALVMFSAVFVAAMIGIASRPIGFLASIWPANAVMLGLMVRNPAMVRWPGWLAGTAAFMIADLLTGSALIKALLLNSANLVSVGTAWLMLVRMRPEILGLKRPSALLVLVGAAAIGGLSSGLVGAMIHPLLFRASSFGGFAFWSVTEMVNYVVVLPAILSFPPMTGWRRILSIPLRLRQSDLVPLSVLFVTSALALMIGGEGALALPMVALLWCALIYPIFATCVLSMVFSVLALVVMSDADLVAAADSRMSLMSFRLGTAAVTLAPVMLSILMRNQEELTARLHELATRDTLTGLMNRGHFLDSARAMLLAGKEPLVMLMVDFDHFKAINDVHGHAAGDEVLRVGAQRIRDQLRPGDLVGRLGGEEFGILLRGCTPDDGARVAERILRAVSRQPVAVDADLNLAVTVSIGLSSRMPNGLVSLEHLMAEADAGLYRAKAGGRNRLAEKLA